VSLSGMVLMVAYEHADEPVRMIWINEGFDIISASDSYCVTSEEATAYVPFTGGTVEPDFVDKATLVTVMQDAFDGNDKNRLYFNGGEWQGIWDTAAKQGDTSISINETDVLAYLDATDNEARLQSHIPEGETTGDGMGAANAILVLTYKEEAAPTFDTGSPQNPYPSIAGVHTGTLEVGENITVRTVYTYPCSDTGGHTEFIKIWNETTGDSADAQWNSYKGDYHNISLNRTLTLKKGIIYNYTIRTGSYPKIHHQKELAVDGGLIRCEKFTDANGKEYDNGIPAFKLY